jgi:hypothetical protein
LGGIVKIRIIHDADGRIEAVLASNAPEEVSLLPADLEGRSVSELTSHNAEGASGHELLDKLKLIHASRVSDLETRPIT